MSNRKESVYRRFLWFGLGVVLAGVLVALPTSTRSLASKRITVSVDTNGTAWLGGAQLPPKIRNPTFYALGAIGVKAKVSLPAEFANGASASQAADTLASVYRAGLLTSNQLPNP
jgi:hypothetical protein